MTSPFCRPEGPLSRFDVEELKARFLVTIDLTLSSSRRTPGFITSG
jgi:hypothetical protein